MNILKQKRGDTIVEVLFAMAIIGLTLSIGYGTANRAIVIGRDAQEQTEATKYVEAQLEKLIIASDENPSVYFSSTTASPFCIIESATVLNLVSDVTQCRFGTIDQGGVARYGVTIVRNANIFTVTGDWNNTRGNYESTAKIVYKTYNYGVAVASPPPPPPSSTCTNPTATNNGGPLPCIFPPSNTCPINPLTGVGYVVGNTGPGGGKVFYTRTSTTNQWCYLESATTNQALAVGWNCSFFTITPFGFGYGKENTDTITANCPNASNPARIARSYNGGGLNDWYLPSASEITRMYANRTNIGGTFSGRYWSSSIIVVPFGYDFSTNNLYISIPGTSQDNVRAIRRF